MSEKLGFDLKRISREIDSIAEAVLHRAERRSLSAESSPDARMIRALIRANRRRSELFGGACRAPAWGMILDLMAAKLEGKQISVSSLCIASGAPATTALRWIGVLVANGVFIRTRDPSDQRRIYISISESAEAKLRAYFDDN